VIPAIVPRSIREPLQQVIYRMQKIVFGKSEIRFQKLSMEQGRGQGTWGNFGVKLVRIWLILDENIECVSVIEGLGNLD
jgi:hypothetical protein